MSLHNVVTMFNKTIYLKIVVIFTLTFLNISIQSEYSDVTSNIPSANFSKNTNSTTNAIRNSTTFPPYPYHHLLTTNNINSPKVSNAVLHYKQSENAKTIRGIQNKGTRRKEGLFEDKQVERFHHTFGVRSRDSPRDQVFRSNARDTVHNFGVDKFDDGDDYFKAAKLRSSSDKYDPSIYQIGIFHI